MLNVKKGQFSIFIVIGMIIILVGAFIYFNSKYDIFLTADSKLKDEVKKIVEDCTIDAASRGAFLLGFQGGRIFMPDYVEIDRFNFQRKYIDLGFKIPNWDSQTGGDIPNRASMELELEEFISDEAYSCIRPLFLSLEETYLDMSYPDEFIIESSINNQNIVIDVDFPVTFNEKNSPDNQLKISDYNVILDNLRLGELHELAVKIYNEALSSNFMEELVLDQIYSASDYSSNRFSMPSEGILFSCVPQIWTKDRLKDNLANLNNNNFKYLQFEGTFSKDYLFEANLNENNNLFYARDYYRNNYRVDLGIDDLSYIEYEVDTFLPHYTITNSASYTQRYPFRTFDVNPSNGEIVKAMNLKVDENQKVPLPCIQIYHHLYNLDYDLIIKISDRNEDSQNYFFQFPLRVLIEDNTAKQKPASIVLDESVTATNEAYCVDEQKQYPILLFVNDANNGESLIDVNISYKCINLECDIGKTEKPEFLGVTRVDAQANLDTNFPFCIGGSIIAKKTGYHEGKIRVDTNLDSIASYERGAFYSIDLYPLKEFEVDRETFLIEYIDGSDAQGRNGLYILSEENGFVYLTIENQGLDYENVVLWPVENEGLFDTIKLIDSNDINYNITAVYVDSENNFRGLLEIENWKPNVNLGNRIVFRIPAMSKIIEEEEFVNFYNQMEDLVENSQYSGFGVRFE
jgi:hypothetical protein